MIEINKQKVRETIADKLGYDLEDIEDDTNLFQDLGMDSLDSIELIMEFEKMFECEILDSDAEEVVYVKDVFTLLDKSIK